MEKLSLNTLSLEEMEKIEAGSGFCHAFFIGTTAWAVGAALNVWNPPGLAATLVLAGVAAYCEFK
jgi:hypothetical protein